jgi:TonB family protein
VVGGQHTDPTKHARKNLLLIARGYAYYASMIFRARRLMPLLLLLTCGAAAQTEPQNTGAYRVGGAISAPKATYAPDPEYSEQARKAKHQGTSILWLIVDANGLPQNIKVQRALGMGLDEEAIKAVKRWRFQPATKDGQPVPVMINVEVNFRLYNSLHPHPDSTRQLPRFPGVDISQYPLLVRVGHVSFSNAGAVSTASYKGSITDAGQERQVTISCMVESPDCQVLDDGTYPARWKENLKSLEILGLVGRTKKWAKTEYTVDAGDR